jgi:hypothetical protein
MRFHRARHAAPSFRPAVVALLGVLLCASLLAISRPLLADGAVGNGVGSDVTGGSDVGNSVVANSGAGVWLDVPFVKQDKDACGAASIAMVMRYWRQQEQHDGQDQAASAAADAEAIQRALYSPQARGIYASDLQRYLQEQQFRTFAFEGAWSDLREQLTKGRPLIVALKTGHDALHYVVVAGVVPATDHGPRRDGQSDDVVLTNDPAQRKLLKQDRATFEREWKATGNWTLLAVPQTSAEPSR